MNIHARATTGQPAMSSEEWEARVDLAAVYRLVAHHGWDDVIYNHCSMRVPGEDRKFLMKRHELLWTEVTASNLVKVDMDDGPRRARRRQPARIHAARRRACAGGPTSTARCTSTPEPEWRSPASRAGCG